MRDAHKKRSTYAAVELLRECLIVDDEKRTAFAATYVLLAINGLDIIETDDEVQDFLLRFYATSSITRDHLRDWLGENAKTF